jgi:prenyltransferase beta subunit
MLRHRAATTALLLIVFTLAFSTVVQASSPGDAAAQALAWLKTQQNSDGGFGSGFGPGSAVGPTTDAIIAIASGGQDVSTWTNGDRSLRSPIDYLRGQVEAGNVRLPGEIAKAILALIATGQDPHAFGGRDLVADLNGHFNTASGMFSSSVYDQALAILALRNAAEPAPDAAVSALLGAQTVEGGWAFDGSTIAGAADSNTTSLAVQALVAAGRKDDTGRALDYFRRVQNADAGWTYQVPSAFGTDTDANSTALGIQAILAGGDSASNWSTGASDPIGALLSLQNADGSFSFNRVFPGANTLATLQAIPALIGDTLVRVTPASGAAVPALLPVAGGAIEALPIAALGAILIAAGILMRRACTHRPSN